LDLAGFAGVVPSRVWGSAQRLILRLLTSGVSRAADLVLVVFVHLLLAELPESAHRLHQTGIELSLGILVVLLFLLPGRLLARLFGRVPSVGDFLERSVLTLGVIGKPASAEFLGGIDVLVLQPQVEPLLERLGVTQHAFGAGYGVRHFSPPFPRRGHARVAGKVVKSG
jgi:hypothetical protein